MRLKILLPALLMTMASSAASAEPTPIEGIVRSVDPQADTVVLEDGSTYRAARGVEVGWLRPGAKVIIYFYTYDGQRTVVSYEYVLTK